MTSFFKLPYKRFDLKIWLSEFYILIKNSSKFLSIGYASTRLIYTFFFILYLRVIFKTHNNFSYYFVPIKNENKNNKSK